MSGTVEALIVDLDGVVYTGGEPCPGAVVGLREAREAGVALLFMTNNASRTPAQVAEHLGSLAVTASPEEVLTSSQVGAAHLAQLRSEDGLDDQDPLVLAVGGPGVAQALQEMGLSVVTAAQAREQGGPGRAVWAVLQGYGPEMMVRDLHEAAYAITSGAHWVATNTDATLPTPRGLVPGNGALVGAVAHGTGATPVVTGKPHRPAYRIALERLGLPADRVLAVGDRLDTDIDGALDAGVPAALVLTGVSSRAEAEARPAERRPQHIAETIPDLAHLWR